MRQSAADGLRRVARTFVFDGDAAVVADGFQPANNAFEVHHPVPKCCALKELATPAGVATCGTRRHDFPILEMDVNNPRCQSVEGNKVILAGKEEIAGV